MPFFFFFSCDNLFLFSLILFYHRFIDLIPLSFSNQYLFGQVILFLICTFAQLLVKYHSIKINSDHLDIRFE
jgi:hypothetical protein